MSKSDSKNKYAISHWPDTEDLQKRLYHLANELPIHQIKRDKHGMNTWSISRRNARSQKR